MSESGKPQATPFRVMPELPGADPARPPAGDARMSHLIRTIEGEIVPRLLMSLRASLSTVQEGHLSAAAELAEFVLASREAAAAVDLDELRAGLNRLEAVIHRVKSLAPQSR